MWIRAPPSSTPPTPPTPLDGPTTDPATHRDRDGRLFNGVTPENFQFLLEKVGFHRINRWDEDDTLGPKERRWATQLFRTK